jgi:hypothetical protein
MSASVGETKNPFPLVTKITNENKIADENEIANRIANENTDGRNRRGVRIVSGWLLVGASDFKKKKKKKKEDERETEEDGGNFKKEKIKKKSNNETEERSVGERNRGRRRR